MPVTSPIAQRRSATLRCESTETPCALGSIPTVSRPIPSTRGRRPVATRSQSPLNTRPPVTSSRYSSPSRRAAVDDGHVAAEAANRLRHLDADRPAAEHEQPARNGLHARHLTVRPDAVEL